MPPKGTTGASRTPNENRNPARATHYPNVRHQHTQ